MTHAEQLRRVVEYYESTRFDYRVTWTRRRSLAVHFGIYDQQASHHFAALENTNRVLAEFASIRPGSRILDAGCGLGNAAFWLAREREAEVVGITPVPFQVESCRQEAARSGLGHRCQFLRGDYHATGLPTESFDVIWACESVCHSPDKELFYAEAARLLRPGGMLVMAEYMRTAPAFSPAEEQLLNNWLRGWAIPGLLTLQQHQTLLLKAGLEGGESREVTAQVRVSLRNLYQHARRWLPLGRFLRWIGVRSPVQHLNHRGAYFQFLALQKNLWEYRLLKARKP